MKIFSAFALITLSGCATKTQLPVAVNPTPATQPTRAKPKAKLTSTPTRSEVRAVEFSPDLKWLATGTLQRIGTDTVGNIAVHEVTSDRLVKAWKVKQGVYNLAFSPDGETLAMSDAALTLSVWNWKTGRLLYHEIPKYAELPDINEISLAFSPDGRTLATGSNGIKLFNLKNWKHQSLPDDILPPRSVFLHFSPEGRFLLATNNFDTYDGPTLIELKNLKARTITKFVANDKAVFSPDGHWIAANGYSTTVESGAFIWNTRTWKLQRTFKSENFYPQAFSPDARFVAGLNLESDGEGRVEVWSVATGKRVRAFQQTARRVAWRDSKTLLLGDENGVRGLHFHK